MLLLGCLVSGHISRVSDQNGVSLLYIMLEIHRSGREPSISSLENFLMMLCENLEKWCL